MGNGKVMRNLGIVGSIIGAIMAIIGYQKLDEANSMMGTLKAGADLFGMDDATERSMSVWQGHAHDHRIVMVIGLLILAVSVTMLIVGIILSANKNNVQQATSQQEIPVAAVNNSTDIMDRLKKLDELKEKGFISEEEYSAKRKDIMSSL